MSRTEMINMLLDNLKRMNHHKVVSGEINQKLLDEFIAEQCGRYEMKRLPQGSSFWRM